MAGLSSEDKFARNPHRASRDQQGHGPAMGRAGKAGRPPHPVFRMFHASPPPASTTARPGAMGAQAAILCDPSRRIAQRYSHGFLIRDLELIHPWSGKSPLGPATPAPNAHTCQGCEGPAGPAKETCPVSSLPGHSPDESRCREGVGWSAGSPRARGVLLWSETEGHPRSQHAHGHVPAAPSAHTPGQPRSVL